MADEPVTNNELEINKNDVVDKKSEISTPRKRSQPSQRPQQQRQRQHTRNQSGTGYRRSGRFQSRRKVCAFCVDKVKVIDWKKVNALRRFMNNNGSIRARRKTGTCAKHQRQLAVAIKRARHLALTPFTDEHVRLAGKN